MSFLVSAFCVDASRALIWVGVLFLLFACYEVGRYLDEEQRWRGWCNVVCVGGGAGGGSPLINKNKSNKQYHVEPDMTSTRTCHSIWDGNPHMDYDY